MEEIKETITSINQEQINSIPKPKSSFKANIGDGTNKTFTVTHNLNTRDVLVQLYDNTTYKVIYADITITSVNTITVSGFINTPTSNQYRVLIQAV